MIRYRISSSRLHINRKEENSNSTVEKSDKHLHWVVKVSITNEGQTDSVRLQI